MHIPRRPFKRVRRTILKVLHRGAGLEFARGIREREEVERVKRDLERLRRIRAARPELEVRITCFGRRDGAGGQALSIISALAFAENHGCRYFHTPFRRIAHAPGDQAEWTRRWEEFLGLGAGEAPVPPDAVLMPLRRFVRFCRRDPRYQPDPRTIVHAFVFGYREFSQHDIGRLKPRLRAKYLAHDKSAIPLHQSAGALTVAIHVRRGDLHAGYFRYMPDAPILNTIARLRLLLAAEGRHAVFNLYSEGPPEQFRPYRDAGCRLHLGTDTFETFHNLVEADLLVAAPSAFSRAAALLSEGIVLAPGAHWDGHRDWLTRARDGSFDRAALAAMLERHERVGKAAGHGA